MQPDFTRFTELLSVFLQLILNLFDHKSQTVHFFLGRNHIWNLIHVLLTFQICGQGCHCHPRRLCKRHPDLWRLNTFHRVEELKSLIWKGPIWSAGILLIIAQVQQSIFSLQQAKTMNRSLTKSFLVPAGWMTIFTLIAILATIVLYDRVFVPITETDRERTWNFFS